MGSTIDWVYALTTVSPFTYMHWRGQGRVLLGCASFAQHTNTGVREFSSAQFRPPQLLQIHQHVHLPSQAGTSDLYESILLQYPTLFNRPLTKEPYGLLNVCRSLHAFVLTILASTPFTTHSCTPPHTHSCASPTLQEDLKANATEYTMYMQQINMSGPYPHTLDFNPLHFRAVSAARMAQRVLRGVSMEKGFFT